MRLVLAIINDNDSRKVMRELNKNGFGVTKLYSAGGFLRTGNTTLLIGVTKRNINAVIDIIKKNTNSYTYPCHSHMISYGVESLAAGCVADTGPLYPETPNVTLLTQTDQITVGKATIFVINAKQGGKILQLK